jgi:hypothetical protein
MVQLFKFLSKLFGVERTISESVKLIEQIFDNYSEEQVFLDLVLARFEHYDESNRANVNGHFSADIEFIIHCTTASLTIPEHQILFPRRVDAYFYIYRRCIEYIELARESKEQMNGFRTQLHDQLASTFELTQGFEPNLCSRNKDLIQKINIRRHLMSIAEISDIKTLHIFFVLCKLSFQSSLSVDDNDHLQWIDIFSKIDHCKLSLVEIISQYIEYKQAFEHRPLDVQTFIYLIRTMHPPKDNQMSPFEFFNNTIRKLNLDHKTFFDQFQPVFAEGLSKQLYNTTHIASLLQMLSTQGEQLFNSYLTKYLSNVSPDIMWTMFLYISKTGDINEIMQKNFSSTLMYRTQAVTIETFTRYYQLTKECLTTTKDANRRRLLKTFEDVFHAFLNKQLNDDQYSYQLSELHLKQLLSIALELSSTNSLQHPSYLPIMRHLLFKLNKHVLKKSTKIRDVFDRVNRLDREMCETTNPADIIQDVWLNEYSFCIPQEWCMLNNYDYTNLCDIHYNNRWSIYIWSRVVYLSIIKSEGTKPNEILVALNEWMKNVKRDIYDTNDILTITFVKNVFENIIAKHMKSVLSFSNINLIIQYVMHIREDTTHLIDRKLVDDFVETVKQAIKDVLLLNGKIFQSTFMVLEAISSHYRYTYNVSSIIK